MAAHALSLLNCIRAGPKPRALRPVFTVEGGWGSLGSATLFCKPPTKRTHTRMSNTLVHCVTADGLQSRVGRSRELPPSRVRPQGCFGWHCVLFPQGHGARADTTCTHTHVLQASQRFSALFDGALAEVEAPSRTGTPATPLPGSSASLFPVLAPRPRSGTPGGTQDFDRQVAAMNGVPFDEQGGRGSRQGVSPAGGRPNGVLTTPAPHGGDATWWRRPRWRRYRVCVHQVCCSCSTQAKGFGDSPACYQRRFRCIWRYIVCIRPDGWWQWQSLSIAIVWQCGSGFSGCAPGCYCHRCCG